MKSKEIGYIINAVLQTLSIGLLTIFEVSYGMYLVMAMLSVVTFIQVFAASAIFSESVNFESIKIDTDNTKKSSTSILICLLYAISCYYIYMMGFVFLSGVFATQVLISLLSNIMKES